MKIIVSLDEAREAARRHFNLPVSATIVISRSKKRAASSQAVLAEAVIPKHTFAEVPDALKRLIASVDSLVATRNMIGAIREVRAFSSCGLKSGKDIVENWASVRAQALAKGYLPQPVYGVSSACNSVTNWT